MDSNYIVLFLTVVVIVSYIFNIISKKIKVPSVLLLLATGIGLQFVSASNYFSESTITQIVELLGTIGLIMIILEAALDLHISPQKVRLISNAFLSALFILFVSSFGIAFIIHYWLNEEFVKCLVYAVPLSIVSSAIVLPSIDLLTEEKKDFIIYEASFSDILGILFFNYLIEQKSFSFGSTILYTSKIGLSIGVSFAVALALVYLLSKIEFHIKFFLIFAVLIALYALGKIFHLPSLLIIMLFGLLVNNPQFIRPKFLMRNISEVQFKDLEKQIKSITAETSFLVRTFFFIIFGYSINLKVLVDNNVMAVGSIIVVLLLIIRFVFLKYLNPKENPLPELLIMPRGLITILLFYKIPSNMILEHFNKGILFFVILLTSILMMFGLFTSKKEIIEDIES